MITVNLLFSTDNPRIFIAGHDLFPERSLTFINEVIRALNTISVNTIMSEPPEIFLDTLRSSVKRYLYDHSTQQIESLENILTIGETAEDIIAMFFATDSIFSQEKRPEDYKEAVMAFNEAIKFQDQWNRSGRYPPSFRSHGSNICRSAC